MPSQLNHSYFKLFDAEFGWGNTTQFTFFSEFNRSNSALPFIEAFVLLTVFLFSIAENSLLLIVVLANKNLRTSANFFEANMAASSILFVISAPMIAVGRMTESWLATEVACKFCVFVMHITGYNLIWNMVLVSIDRYNRVLTPGKHKITRRYVFLGTSLIWITSMLFIPQAMYSHLDIIQTPTDNRTITFCSVTYPYNPNFKYSYLMFALLSFADFLIPVSIITHNYIRILRRLNEHKQRFESHITPLSKTAACDLTKAHRLAAAKRRNARHRKISITLITILVLYLVMWLPLVISVAIIFLEGYSETYRMSSSVFIFAVIICFINTCVNPFLYGYNDDKVRSTFKRNIRHICRRVLPKESRIMRNRAMSLPRTQHDDETTDQSLNNSDTHVHVEFTSST